MSWRAHPNPINMEPLPSQPFLCGHHSHHTSGAISIFIMQLEHLKSVRIKRKGNC